MPNTKPRKDWKFTSIYDADADDADDFWDADTIAIVTQYLPMDDSTSALEIINEITEIARSYHAWKTSVIPTKAEVKAYISKCQKAAKKLRDVMQRMDPESHRLLAAKARDDSPTAFDPSRRWRDDRPDESEPGLDLGDARMWQARIIVRRLVGWLDGAAAEEPIARHGTHGAASLVESLIDVWERCNGRRFKRGLNSEGMNYLVWLCQVIDNTLTDDAIDNIAKGHLHSRVVKTP